MKPAALRARILGTVGIFFALFSIAFGRVVQLCVMQAGVLGELASQQQRQQVTLPPDRGPIVDRHGDTLAVTVESADVYLRPRMAQLPEQLIPLVAQTCDLPATLIAAKAHAAAPFVWVQRQATPEQGAAVEALGVRGLGSASSRRRLYPRGALAGQVIGFAGVDLQGLAGVELQYDSDLRRASTSFRMDRDARGGFMLTEGAEEMPLRPGVRLELTLDGGLQQVAEDELEVAVKTYAAVAGIAVVLDPTTGEILALANAPRFDPNRAGVSSPDQWRNRAVTDNYEPGSTFKAITAAAAIEAGLVHPDDRIFCGNGRYAVGKRTIHDHEPYAWLTFADVIKHSSNIGAAKVGERLGAARFSAAIRAFGFGQPTGVDVPGEAAGQVRPEQRWGRINLVTTSFGQGISVTALQLLRAYAAIANGGRLMRPYVVHRVVAADGSVLREHAPQVVGQPISARTAAIVTDLLRGVVDGGTGTKARVDGLAVAGKTGTAQKVDSKTGRYSARARMSSFIGFAPAEAPRFVILVVIDSPRTATYGGLVAAPVFRRIAEFAADRLGLRVPPATTPFEVERELRPQLVSWAAEAHRGMPSFLGLSMREALVQAARAGWEVQTEGWGYVIAQDPPPGTETTRGRRLVLRFGSAAR